MNEEMGFVEGMFVGMQRSASARRRGQSAKVFDWHKAALLIKERQPQLAEAGLAGDWNYTGGEIWHAGTGVPASETYTYLASAWATPQLIMDDDDPIDCWIERGPDCDWDMHTYWPESALAILRGSLPPQGASALA